MYSCVSVYFLQRAAVVGVCESSPGLLECNPGQPERGDGRSREWGSGSWECAGCMGAPLCFIIRLPWERPCCVALGCVWLGWAGPGGRGSGGGWISHPVSTRSLARHSIIWSTRSLASPESGQHFGLSSASAPQFLAGSGGLSRRPWERVRERQAKPAWCSVSGFPGLQGTHQLGAARGGQH